MKRALATFTIPPMRAQQWSILEEDDPAAVQTEDTLREHLKTNEPGWAVQSIIIDPSPDDPRVPKHLAHHFDGVKRHTIDDSDTPGIERLKLDIVALCHSNAGLNVLVVSAHWARWMADVMPDMLRTCLAMDAATDVLDGYQFKNGSRIRLFDPRLSGAELIAGFEYGIIVFDRCDGLDFRSFEARLRQRLPNVEQAIAYIINPEDPNE